MLVSREAILAKVESAYRTDSSPGATDAVFVMNATYGSEANMLERVGVKETLAPFQQVFGGRLVTLSFECEFKGSGAAGTAPEIGALLKGCGFAETVNAGVSVVYTPTSDSIDSLTLYYYQDGKLKKAVGCRGTCQISLNAGEFGKASFTFTGHPGGVSDVSLISPTYDATVPPAFMNAAFSIGGYGAIINSLNIDLANQIAKPRSVAASNAYGEIRIGKRDVSGSFDPEEILVATNDFYGDWESGATAALDTSTVGGTAGNRWRIQMPAVHYRGITEGEREGIRTLEVQFGAIESTSDDEISITFT